MNLLSGLIPAFLVNQLAIIADQSPLTILLGFIFLAITETAAGVILRNMLAGGEILPYFSSL
ncbi:hypothetical protein [Stygiolobus sp. CP859M]|uniref:hypothetical protein n=1 Tax=Stygiolobus sp. CP859M TaxID=3133135 RepID=UPI00307D8531